jgi:hypothetical protein
LSKNLITRTKSTTICVLIPINKVLCLLCVSVESVWEYVRFSVERVYPVTLETSGARILKHLVKAEKSPFRGELSFQRSACTAGLTVATIFVCCFIKTILCK